MTIHEEERVLQIMAKGIEKAIEYGYTEPVQLAHAVKVELLIADYLIRKIRRKSR